MRSALLRFGGEHLDRTVQAFHLHRGGTENLTVEEMIRN